jgi:hypothetical protein
MAATLESGSDTIAITAAIAAVPRSARRRPGDAGVSSGTGLAERSRALGRMNARAARKTAAPAAASMRLVTASIRCGAKIRARTKAATHGKRPTPRTRASRRRGEAARRPVAAPATRNSAMTPATRRIFAQ